MKKHALEEEIDVVLRAGQTIKDVSERLADSLLHQKEDLIWELVFKEAGAYQCLKLMTPRITRELDEEKGSEIYFFDDKPLVYFLKATSKQTKYKMKASMYYYVYDFEDEVPPTNLTLH